MENNKILILSHAFNMDGRAASQTITDKIPFFVKKGWRPQVVSAVTGTRDQEVEHVQVLPWGPSGLRFDLRHKLRLAWGKDWRYRVCMLAASLLLAPFIVLERGLLGRQSQWSWSLAATFAGWRLIAREKPALIFSTGGAYSAHLAGYWLKRLTGLPWIVEVHDPLVTPGQTPRRRDQRFQARLEALICTHADRAWWFTDGALASARRRHPQLGNRGFVVLPGANPPPVKAVYRRGERLVFAHFGSLAASRSLTPFLAALSDWLQAHPQMRSRVGVEVYGGSLDAASVAAIAEHGLQERVVCHGRLEYCPESGLSGRERVIAKMHEADCLLLMHGTIPECAEYIPSKLYEYFWTGRPILALTHDNPQLDALLAARGGYVAPTADRTAIVERIDRIFADWQAGRLDTPAAAAPLGVEQAVDRILDECRALETGRVSRSDRREIQ